MRFLVHSHEPAKDPDKLQNETFETDTAAIRYAQKLNALRVDVIACPDNEKAYFVKRYPVSEGANLHNNFACAGLETAPL